MQVNAGTKCIKLQANHFPKEKDMSEPNAQPRKKITLPYLFKKVAEGSPDHLADLL